MSREQISCSRMLVRDKNARAARQPIVEVANCACAVFFARKTTGLRMLIFPQDMMTRLAGQSEIRAV